MVVIAPAFFDGARRSAHHSVSNNNPRKHTLWKSKRPDEAVYESAKLAEVTEFVEALPEAWATLVGEGGHRLSGGQRQRLAIARAVLKDAPLLILDEATSAVDNETEAALQRSINKITQGRTAVIIAHRLSTVRNADRILVLENGGIREDGTMMNS